MSTLNPYLMEDRNDLCFDVIMMPWRQEYCTLLRDEILWLHIAAVEVI